MRKGVARGVAVLGAGQVVAQALSMVKNIVVARLLGPEDWGVAATFWVALTLMDAVSTLATDRQVVQAEDGAGARFLGTAHAMQAARGFAAGAMVFALSWVAAWAFDTRHALWAYQMIALVPVIRGFSHLGMYVQQREMRFGPTVQVEVWTQAAALVLGVSLGLILRDYSVAVWMYLGQTLVACALSHVFAGMRYAWGWEREAVGRILRFGIPLMANGALMFVVFQGDQAVIGVAYSKETLGLYAAAFGLASIPTMLAGKVASSALLPPLSRAQGEQRVFERRVRGSVESLAMAAGAVGIGFALLGPWAMVALYGAEFAGASGVVGVLGVMWAMRVLRIGPTLGAMARGDTVNSLVANMWRSAAMIGVVWAALRGMDIVWIAAAGVGGEAASLLVSCERLRRKQGVPLSASLTPSLVAVTSMGAALAIGMAAGGVSPLVGFGLFALVSVAMVALMAAVCPGVVAELRAGLLKARQIVERLRGEGASA